MKGAAKGVRRGERVVHAVCDRIAARAGLHKYSHHSRDIIRMESARPPAPPSGASEALGPTLRIDPALPRVMDAIDLAASDRMRIEQAYRHVTSRLQGKEQLDYDMDVAPFLDGHRPYREFLAASKFHETYLPQGEKPRIKGDRRRKRALPHIDVTWHTCSSCGTVLPDEQVEGEDFVCDCGLLLREDEGFELGYKERENYEYRTNSIYRRPNHLNEMLAQLQGLEKTIVPLDILDRVRAEAHKYRIDTAAITMSQVRAILQRLRLPKFYEHSAQIVHTLSGRPPIVIPEAVEQRLKGMFNELDPVYEEHRGRRKNFLVS